jgi:hypothetical protein
VADDRRLPDAALADHEHGPPRALVAHPRDETLERRAAGRDVDGLGQAVVRDHAADEAQELVVLELREVVLPHAAIFLDPRGGGDPAAGAQARCRVAPTRMRAIASATCRCPNVS